MDIERDYYVFKIHCKLLLLICLDQCWRIWQSVCALIASEEPQVWAWQKLNLAGKYLIFISQSIISGDWKIWAMDVMFPFMHRKLSVRWFVPALCTIWHWHGISTESGHLAHPSLASIAIRIIWTIPRISKRKCVANQVHSLLHHRPRRYQIINGLPQGQ